MSTAADFIQKSEKALEAKDLDSALEFANKAISLDKSRYNAYLKKAVILQRLKDFEGSFKAAENGLAKAYKAGIRDSIAEGHLRRGIALISLKRYADAGYSIQLAKKFTDDKNPSKKSLPIWEMKVQSHLQGIDDEDELEVKISEIPEIEAEEEDWKIKEVTDDDSEFKNAVVVSNKLEYPDPETVRHDWFQMGDVCDVSIFIKNAPKDEVSVEFSELYAIVTFPLPDEDKTYQYSIGPFLNSIDASKSTFKVFTTKIELSLAKAKKESWASLLSPEMEASFLQRTEPSLEEVRKQLGSVSIDDKKKDVPVKPVVAFEKNWDKMASEALGNEKEESEDFFQQLYSGADDDAKKAILKSYTESGGTTLSTNWGEVKKGRVPINPPSGMEARKY